MEERKKPEWKKIDPIQNLMKKLIEPLEEVKKLLVAERNKTLKQIREIRKRENS
jgi:pheromone shutdown protein TraB